MSLPDTFWTHAAYQAGDSALRCPLVFGDGLRVGIEGDATGSMPEQLLGDFDVRAARPQQRRAGVAERMPADLLGDSNTSRQNTNSIPHQRLVPVGFSTSAVRACEDPVAGRLVFRVSPPSAQCPGEKRIEWNGFLRRLGLARADNLQDDGTRNSDLVLEEIDIRPLEAEEFAHPQSRDDIEQNHGPFAEIEGP